MIDLGGGPLAADLDHMILAKFDRSGGHLWSRVLSGQVYATNLAVGGTGIVNVASHSFLMRFSGAGDPLDSESVALYVALVDADTLGNSFVLTQGSDYSVSLSSRDAGGANRWHIELAAAGSEPGFEPSSVSAAGDGGVFIAGQLNTTRDFGDGPRAPGALATTLVARYAPSGQLTWSRLIVGGGAASVVATSAGAAVIGSADFSVDPGTGPRIVPYAFMYSAFVVRLAPDGVPTSTKLFDFDSALEPVVTDSGELYIASYDCPGSPGPLGPTGVMPNVVFKLDPNDNVAWGGRLHSEQPVRLDADSQGAVAIGLAGQLAQPDGQGPTFTPYVARFAP